MKKTLLSQAVEAIMAGVMYSSMKAKEAHNSTIKLKNTATTKKAELISSHQALIDKCQKSKKESDEKINIHKIGIAEFLANNVANK